MKVEPFAGDEEHYRDRRRALQRLLGRTRRGGRVCARCALACPNCGSLGCTCTCSPACPQAPGALSSAPERFPIEPGIVPLVYALCETETGLPCWSCEGHADADGKVHKLPQVWFYARHVAYPDMLAHYLWQLHFQGRVEARWSVRIVCADNLADTTFAIAPETTGPDADLAALRGDVRVIGGRMANDLPDIVRAGMRALDRTAAKAGPIPA